MKTKILKFEDMPFEFQRSIVLSNDENPDVEWTDLGQIDWVKDIDSVQIWIDDYSKLYAEQEFRIGIIGIEDIKEKIMSVVEFDTKFDNFEEYHKWYRKNDETDHGDSVFPIIVSNCDEFIEDGWHRFHSYVHKGMKEIPFVEYI